MKTKPDLKYLRDKIYDLNIRKLIIKKNYEKYKYDIASELEKIEYELSEYTYQFLLAGGRPEDIK